MEEDFENFYEEPEDFQDIDIQDDTLEKQIDAENEEDEDLVQQMTQNIMAQSHPNRVKESLGFQIQRTISNNYNYPLTKYEKAKVLSIRARVLSQLLRKKIVFDDSLKTRIDHLNDIKDHPTTSNERKEQIQKELNGIYETANTAAMNERRKFINLTDEEIESEANLLDYYSVSGSALKKFDPIRLALLEYHFRKIPINIIRTFPDGKKYELDVNTLIFEPTSLYVSAYQKLPRFTLPVVF
jgi:hypothetical protein